jgi:hypothetical protein
MSAADVREQIARIESEIEEHAQALERCRKIGLFARVAIVVGAMLLGAILLGAAKLGAAAWVAALAAILGGIVAFGSNISTAQQITAAMQAAEARRAELIGQIQLRLVDAVEEA